MIKKIAIFGYAGSALEIADICASLSYHDILLIANEQDYQKSVCGLKVVDESEVESLYNEGFQFAIGVADPVIREKIYTRYLHFDYPNLIHPSVIFGRYQLDKFGSVIGNIVSAGSIFTNSIIVGNFGLYNLNSSIAHECIIEDFVSIMSKVTISGNVTISKGAFIGVSATILQGSPNNKLVIGEGALIGACSLVTKSVDSGITVVGVPAKDVKK